MSYNHLTFTILLTIFISLSNLQQSFSIIPISGCERCASTGDCNQAFHYSPGKYCGDFTTTTTTTQNNNYNTIIKPCCCPTNSQCQLSSNQCNCYIVPSSGGSGSGTGGGRGFHYDNKSYGSNTDNIIGTILSMITIIGLLLCCCCVCALSHQRQRYNEHLSGEYIPIAVPSYHSGNNPSQPPPPPPTAPDYQATTTSDFDSNPNWGGGRRSRNDGFAWGPALGGFVLGEMMGRNSRDRSERRHHHHHQERWGSDFDDGGGFTISGDNGDGGHHEGFIIRGDS